MVPKNAIVTFAGIEKVFVFEKGKATERRVVTGTTHGNEVELVKGVKTGDAVILDPGALRPGQPVVIGKESTDRDDHHPSNG